MGSVSQILDRRSRRAEILERMEVWLTSVKADPQTRLWAEPVSLEFEDDERSTDEANSMEVVLTHAFLGSVFPRAGTWLWIDVPLWERLEGYAKARTEHDSDGIVKHEYSVEDVVDDLLRAGVRRVIATGVKEMAPYFSARLDALQGAIGDDVDDRLAHMGDCREPLNDIGEELATLTTGSWVNSVGPEAIAAVFLEDEAFTKGHIDRLLGFKDSREAGRAKS